MFEQVKSFAQFCDLPVELLPDIVQHVVKPSHLATLCLVNQFFHTFAIPLLYERVFIYSWHKAGKAKVIKLFKTLAEYPHLAKHVRQLAIREFPKALQSEEYDQVLEACLAGLRNCVNLRACTWTRHGSITSSVLETLADCSRLQELEINGENANYYDPGVLPRFSQLQKLSLIMPSSAVASVLLPWTRNTGPTLRHLSIICKSSTRINDGILLDIARYTANLEYAYFVGCQKLTHEGLWGIVSSNYRGLVGLGMESLSTAFNMGIFSENCNRSGALHRLRSITLTVDEHTSLAEWQQHVLNLLSSAPLQQFHISTVGGHVDYRLSDDFCSAIVSAHGSRLTRFSVHRMRMNINAIADICRRCVALQQLFIVVEQIDIDALGACLARAPRLRAVHINRPLDFGSEDVSRQSFEKMLSIAEQCPYTVQQLGFNTRVFQVERTSQRADDGSIRTKVALRSYENPEIPEQFLVVRT